jgi:hypothetical protein
VPEAVVRVSPMSLMFMRNPHWLGGASGCCMDAENGAEALKRNDTHRLRTVRSVAHAACCCRCLSVAGPGRGMGSLSNASCVPGPRPSTMQGAHTTRAPSLPLRRTVRWIPPAPGPRCWAAGPVGGRPNWLEAKSELTREVLRTSVRWHT